jgi:hypothetical protein
VLEESVVSVGKKMWIPGWGRDAEVADRNGKMWA